MISKEIFERYDREPTCQNLAIDPMHPVLAASPPSGDCELRGILVLKKRLTCLRKRRDIRQGILAVDCELK